MKPWIPLDDALEIGFADFNEDGSRAGELPEAIKLDGPKAGVAADLEPECIAVAPDGLNAFVSLQENNAMAIIDLVDESVLQLVALGAKDLGKPENAAELSDKDGTINITTYPGLYQVYQPDTLDSYDWHGETFVVSANEGDSRAYEGYSEEARVADAVRDSAHPQFGRHTDEAGLGRMKFSTAIGDDDGDGDGDGDIDRIYGFGGRSFSIWSSAGRLVYDSTNDFEVITSALLEDAFNTTNTESAGDSRSDNRGPEPEALEIATIWGRSYAFIGLERVSGMMVYDITNPFDVVFIDYLVNRDFSADFEIDSGEVVNGDPKAVGDLAPESIRFVAATDSPNARPRLIVGDEASGSTSVYQLRLH